MLHGRLIVKADTQIALSKYVFHSLIIVTWFWRATIIIVVFVDLHGHVEVVALTLRQMIEVFLF